MRYLGVDLGTSFIKGAVLDLEALDLGHIERVPMPEPVPGLPPAFREFDPMRLWSQPGRCWSGCCAAPPTRRVS